MVRIHRFAHLLAGTLMAAAALCMAEAALPNSAFAIRSTGSGYSANGKSRVGPGDTKIRNTVRAALIDVEDSIGTISACKICDRALLSGTNVISRHMKALNAIRFYETAKYNRAAENMFESLRHVAGYIQGLLDAKQSTTQSERSQSLTFAFAELRLGQRFAKAAAVALDIRK